MKKSQLLFFTGLLSLLIISGCGDDDEPDIPSSTFTVTIENVFEGKSYSASGVFNTPVGADAPGPAMPGSSYTFGFNASRGSHLSFATMFVQSNDLFYAPGQNGLALYDESGVAISGDVTAEIDLWDAGTEVNEAPYLGDNQAPRQSGANSGENEGGVVQLVDDGFTYPMDENVKKVTITPSGSWFDVTIENVSSGDTATPFAPGVFVVHPADATPLFTSGEMDRGEGLEGVAEDGGAADLGAVLEVETGYSSPYAPGVFAIHESGINALFESGNPDLDEGLEALAEDGDPSGLGAALSSKTGVLSSGIFNTPDEASAAGPLLPGATYSFTFDASDGSYLNLATMLVQTNDLFYAFGAGGISLFENGTPISGDVTSQLSLWDAGTEVNEYPGTGINQPVRQSGANTGEDKNGNVMIVNDNFSYPSTADAIKVTISN